MDDGTIGFGVVQGTYEKWAENKVPGYIQPITTKFPEIKSHEGENNDYQIDKFYW